MSRFGEKTKPDDLRDSDDEIDDYVSRLIEGDEAIGAESVASSGDRAEKIERKPIYKRRFFLIAAAITFVIVSVAGVRYWQYTRTHESTDDAFIDAHLIQISPKVAGYVTKVYVKGNQEVKEGDLLAEVDARDYEARLEQAKAALDAGMMRLKEAHGGVELTRASTRAKLQQASATVQRARSGVETSRSAAAAEGTRIVQAAEAVKVAQANLEQMRSQVNAAEAEAARANADVERYQALFNKDEVSRQRLDKAVAAARAANAQLEAARAKVAAAESQVAAARSAQATAAEEARGAQTQVGGAQAGVGVALGQVAQANTAPQQLAVSQAHTETVGADIDQLRAAVEQAELELSYTKIYAPAPGHVTRKSVEAGALVQVGQPLMTIVRGDVWVTANFKENQIGRINPGQAVEIKVDAYPSKVFKAHVDSIQAGTGARFSLIPQENATGNYVKVVQRIPVKIVFDDPPDPDHVLAPGMSVEPEVRIK